MLHAPTICVRCKLYMHVAFSNAHSYEHTCYSLRPALKSIHVAELFYQTLCFHMCLRLIRGLQEFP